MITPYLWISSRYVRVVFLNYWHYNYIKSIETLLASAGSYEQLRNFGIGQQLEHSSETLVTTENKLIPRKERTEVLSFW